jgi:WD40 repeat protein
MSDKVSRNSSEVAMLTRFRSVSVIVIALAGCLWGNPRKPAPQGEYGPTKWITSVAFSADDRSIFATNYAKPTTLTVTQWDIATGKGRRALTIQIDSESDEDGLSRDARALAVINNAEGFKENNTITLWDVATAKQLHTLSGHGLKIDDVDFSADGRTLASGSDDQTIRLWDIATGKQLKMLINGDELFGVVAFSPNAKMLASAGDNSPSGESQVGDTVNTIELWDATGGQVIQTLSRQKFWTSALAFSPDGRTLASASWDNTITLWDVASGKVLYTLSGHTEIPDALAFSPDGRTLASGSGDNTVKLWDVATGQLLRTLTGHTDQILSVAFSPDGRSLASAGFDNTVKLWDVTTGKLLSTFGVPNPPSDNTGSSGATQ